MEGDLVRDVAGGHRRFLRGGERVWERQVRHREGSRVQREIVQNPGSSGHRVEVRAVRVGEGLGGERETFSKLPV